MIGKVIRLENKLVVVKIENQTVLKCNMRGKLKLDKKKVIVGDMVNVDYSKGDTFGIITDVLPRKNELIRPLVSNIDQVLLFFAVAKPDINYEILDTFLAVIENKKIDIVLCFNKIELNNELAINLKKRYEKIGYDVLLISAKENIGIENVKSMLKGKATVFAGPSGVGKSSVLNLVLGQNIRQTGDISSKTQNGKHTTKAVELIEIGDNSFVFDTPGFTAINLLDINDEDLLYTFREFRRYIGHCKYSKCLHIKEEGCEIKNKVVSGDILVERYNMYLKFYDRLKKRADFREKSNKIYKGKKKFITSKELNKRNK